MGNSYTGYQQINLSEEELAKFYLNQNILLDLYTVKDYSGNIKDCVKYDKSCKTL